MKSSTVDVGLCAIRFYREAVNENIEDIIEALDILISEVQEIDRIIVRKNPKGIFQITYYFSKIKHLPDAHSYYFLQMFQCHVPKDFVLLLKTPEGHKEVYNNFVITYEESFELINF